MIDIPLNYSYRKKPTCKIVSLKIPLSKMAHTLLDVRHPINEIRIAISLAEMIQIIFYRRQ